LNVSFRNDEQGRPKGAYVIGYDITQQKQAQETLRQANQLLQEQAEELERRVGERTRELQAALATEKSLRTQLIQSEKFAALARLVGSVAHEINNPLQSVKNCLYLVQCESLPPGLDDVVNMAIAETQRMSNLVKQLRDTYRPSTLQAIDFDLVELLARVMSLLAPQFRQNEIQWELQYSSDSIMLHGIPDQIQQVCLNICINAIDVLGARDGRFEISVRESENPDRVRVSFRDNGPGISKEYLGQLFEPFFTTKEKGTGLGLAICYEIVKNHGGDIEVESEPGQGATFIVTLPKA
jgi:signal transduction histidine kinase